MLESSQIDKMSVVERLQARMMMRELPRPCDEMPSLSAILLAGLRLDELRRALKGDTHSGHASRP